MSRLLLEMPQIEQVLRRDIKQAGGLTQWARLRGVSRVHLSKVLHGHKPLGPKIISALGLEKVPSPRARKVLRILSEEIEKAGSQSEWARRTGVNRTTLNQVISGRRKPNSDIFRALKIQTVVAYASKRAHEA
jgi:DNA-binding phage protein